jgi:putative membrane protein
MLTPLLLLADHEPGSPWHPQTLAEALMATAVFGVLGIVLLFVGYKIFDLLTPNLHIEKELAEKNWAVAVVIAALLLSVGLIVARTVG